MSRLRRALRTALLAAAALTIALLVAASHERAPRIGADPVAPIGMDGTWHVVATECAPGAPPACATARGTRVRIEGNTMTIGTLELDVADTLREYHAHVEMTNATIHVESDLGSVTLSRD